MFKNKNLLIIALIAVVNALGYGIIIPILYTYSRRFGLNDFQNGLLFAVFSVCSLIATPIIGRLSDKYGRRPLLIISIAGTAISFLMQAFAPSAIFLFLARGLDGITAGNITVASAVISDTTEPKDRAKGFGIIGAAFGFGFVFGPAIAAFTVGINPSLPFIIAAIVTTIAFIITALFLPETNKHMGEVKTGKMFDFAPLFHMLFDNSVGKTLLVSLFFNIAFGMFIFAYQPVAVKIIHMSANQIATVFTIFGVVGLIAQALLVPRANKLFGEKKTLTLALILSSAGFIGMFFARSFPLFVLLGILIGLGNSFVMPMVQTLLSKETDAKSQGSIMGVNASYMNIGTILGPIIGGILSSLFVPSPFVLGGIVLLIALYFSRHIKPPAHPESAY